MLITDCNGTEIDANHTVRLVKKPEGFCSVTLGKEYEITHLVPGKEVMSVVFQGDDTDNLVMVDADCVEVVDPAIAIKYVAKYPDNSYFVYRSEHNENRTHSLKEAHLFNSVEDAKRYNSGAVIVKIRIRYAEI